MGTILVTGAAGFIGFHLCQRLLDQGATVFGIDNLSDYYDVSLKQARLAQLAGRSQFQFQKLDISDRLALADLFQRHSPEQVVHLAAQPGVRYSLINPHAYADSNLTGFLNILEGCRHSQVKHLVYASSSSVYGANTQIPFSVSDNVDHPISLYAATKKANELMAHSYSHLYQLPTTGLRFFTVYGPWGRPDMALFLFTKAILEGRAIDIFNHGKMKRDFTYIDDVVTGICLVLAKIPQPNPNWTATQPDPGSSSAPYRIYNIGNNQPVELIDFIHILEQSLGIEARKNLLPLQQGDLPMTYANIDDLETEVGFRPEIPIEVGIPNFVAWYRSYFS
ncbi:MAG: NAD-dependent epimerase [Kovacikia sp.]